MLLAIDLGRSPRTLWGWAPAEGEREFSREDVDLMHAARDLRSQTSSRGNLYSDEVDPEGDPQNGYGAFEWQVSTRTNYAVKAIELERANFERELTTGALKDLDEDAKRFARAGLIYEVTKVPR